MHHANTNQRKWEFSTADFRAGKLSMYLGTASKIQEAKTDTTVRYGKLYGHNGNFNTLLTKVDKYMGNLCTFPLVLL